MASSTPTAAQRIRKTFRPMRTSHMMLAMAVFACVFTPRVEAAGQSTSVNWRMYNGNYSADRFSPLKQLTRKHVSVLTEVSRYQLPETTSFQARPVVVGDALFVTTATSTYAMHAATGTLLLSSSSTVLQH